MSASAKRPLSYKKAGIDVKATDAAKRGMSRSLRTSDARVLNTLGAFASLYDASFPEYEHPVLVLKTEEPGTKQLIAAKHNRLESVCEDMINHLINDIAVMGATPLSVQDAVICGKADPKQLNKIVDAIAAACRAQGCSLTGGETSIQPGVVEPGTYILTASVVGVVEKARIIDGSAIREGDVVLAVASNGLHTNGYTLVRTLMREQPSLARKKINGKSFLDAILQPHVCYYQGLKGLFRDPAIHGMAHITGGGIEGNLNRILPKRLDALIERDAINILPIFSAVREAGNVSDAEMLRTFNMGVGLTIVAHSDGIPAIQAHLAEEGYESYPIGEIVKGKKTVCTSGKLQWE